MLVQPMVNLPTLFFRHEVSQKWAVTPVKPFLLCGAAVILLSVLSIELLVITMIL